MVLLEIFVGSILAYSSFIDSIFGLVGLVKFPDDDSRGVTGAARGELSSRELDMAQLGEFNRVASLSSVQRKQQRGLSSLTHLMSRTAPTILDMVDLCHLRQHAAHHGLRDAL